MYEEVMSVLNFVLEVLVLLLRINFEILKAIINKITPARVHYKDISGKTILITGAGSGIGRLMAIRFAKFGCKLVLWDLNKSANEETANTVIQYGVEAFPYTVDLSKRVEIQNCAKKVHQEAGKVDILINNAGVVSGKSLLENSDQMIELTMQVNTMSHFWTIREFLPAMLTANDGHIVTIASSAGIVGVSALADYCASKFGAVGLDESLRMELEQIPDCQVFTTVVCPFYINTGMFDGVRVKFPQVMDILNPHDTVQKIIDAILTNQTVLYIPNILYPLFIMKSILPTSAMRLISEFMGVQNMMSTFKGRGTAPPSSALPPSQLHHD